MLRAAIVLERWQCHAVLFHMQYLRAIAPWIIHINPDMGIEPKAVRLRSACSMHNSMRWIQVLQIFLRLTGLAQYVYAVCMQKGHTAD